MGGLGGVFRSFGAEGVGFWGLGVLGLRGFGVLGLRV